MAYLDCNHLIMLLPMGQAVNGMDLIFTSKC